MATVEPGLDLPKLSPQDVASASNHLEAFARHYILKLDIDFDAKQVKGNVEIHMERKPEATEVRLDVHKLKVLKAFIDGKEVEFEVSDFTDFGSRLTAKLPEKTGSIFRFSLDYHTLEDSPAACFMTPEQTAGKTHPFLYTQGQACLNRSLFPCQDTPALRITYDATVTCPEGFTAVMSAQNKNAIEGDNLVPEVVETEGGAKKNKFSFKMPFSIPVYLVALAVGNLRCRPIGPRSRVWCEPNQLEKAAFEFGDTTEQYLATGEKLFGTYRWKQYDILVMPPSFPFGGMENPMLTFVTPCLLAGDKSLTDVICHEIAHSWFGNLVTNRSWEEFFLNEGFTMYAQRRICQEVHGRAFTALETKTGLALLKETIDNQKGDKELTKLRVVIGPGVDPDDTYNEVPYEKGYCFVSYLRNAVGSDEEFDGWLKAYVDKFAFACVTANDMLEHFLAHFPKLRDEGFHKKEGFDFHTWLFGTGWPVFTPDLSEGDGLAKPAEDLLAKWLSTSEADRKEAAATDVLKWPVYQMLHFLDCLLQTKEDKSHVADVMKEMDAVYKFSEHNNAEVRLRWSQAAARFDFAGAFASIADFLQSQGKQKYTLPIYRELVKGSEEAKQLATQTFTETKPTLHPNVRGYVAEILTA